MPHGIHSLSIQRAIKPITMRFKTQNLERMMKFYFAMATFTADTTHKQSNTEKERKKEINNLMSLFCKEDGDK